MGKILPFRAKQPSKFDFEKVRKPAQDDPDQQTLFSREAGQVLRFPVSVRAFEEALQLDERGDQDAEKAYRRAISEGDHVADAYCNLGIIESRAGKTAKAFDCFTKSLECDPRHFEAHYNLGNLYFEGDNLRLARMHYELAAEIDPSFPNTYYNLGLVLALLEEQQAAIDAFAIFQRGAPPEECRKVARLIVDLKRSLAASDKNTGLYPF